MLAGYALLYPFAIMEQTVRLRSGSSRYYFSPARTAVLGVSATKGAWLISAHASADPGHGEGAALRALLLPVIVTAADEGGVAIVATAANRTLARRYMAELPGLRDVGRGFPRGRRLRREPAWVHRDRP
ncbi:hypothetical protein M3697_14830 [Janibacter melonis]|uniref:hypothetical protein n=1 Tax=Janibacter melonis TaxID=262209 RepID=UPI002043EED1|nr:hypothetical protein [Janibacter melonis]MCM3556363.1 hypothetical protein [Janibacter melonis]